MLPRRNHHSSQSSTSQTYCLGPKPSHRPSHLTLNHIHNRCLKATLDQLTSLNIPLTQEAATTRILNPRMARDRHQATGWTTVCTSVDIQTRGSNRKADTDIRPSQHRTLRLTATSQSEGRGARERDQLWLSEERFSGVLRFDWCDGAC